MKRGTLVIAVVLASAVLAGCTTGPDGSTPPGTTAPTDTPTTADTPDEPPTPSPTTRNRESPTRADPTAESRSTTTQSTTTTTTIPATTTTRTTTAGVDDVTLRNGPLPVEADLIYGRVERLLNASAPAPTVTVRRGNSSLAPLMGQRPFAKVFGLTGWKAANNTHGKTSPSTGAVTLLPGSGNASEIERVLAHEYVHVLQFQADVVPASLYADARSTDDRLVVGAMVEGGAVYASDAYIRQYTNSTFTQTDRLGRQVRQGPDAWRLFRSRYYVGAQYLHHRLDSPAALPAAYRDPPGTMEAIIHNRSADPQPPLSVEVATGEQWDSGVGGDTMGELMVRNVLYSELNWSRAGAGAAGWGTDRLHRLTDAGNVSRVGLAWAIRWDTPGNASEFATAFRAYAEERDDDTTRRFRIERVGPETTVVVAGDPAFVRNATISGSNANVSVKTRG